MLSFLASAAMMGGVYYGVTPAILWRAMPPSPAQFTFERLAVEELPAEISARMQHAASELQGLGFEMLGYLREPTMNGYVALLIHRGTGAMALVSSLKHLWWAEFSTRTEDGTRYNTSNIDNAGVFSDHPQYRDVRLPGVSSLAHLWLLHRKRLAAEAPRDMPSIIPEPGTEIQALARAASFSTELQAELGMYTLRGDGYRLTLKGAYLSAWRLLPPYSRIRLARLRQAAARRIREMDRVAPPPATRPVVVRADA